MSVCVCVSLSLSLSFSLSFALSNMPVLLQESNVAALKKQLRSSRTTNSGDGLGDGYCSRIVRVLAQQSLKCHGVPHRLLDSFIAGCVWLAQILNRN